MAAPFIPPTPDEFDALGFTDQVRVLTKMLGIVLDGYRHRLAVRQRDGRELSAADRRNLRAIEQAIACLLVESQERLEPGSVERQLRETFAALAEAQGDGRA